MNENSKNASVSTLILMTLKDIRNERGVHQGHIAKSVGKSPSAWSKIENGQSQLTVDAMMGACWALQINPSYVMTLVDTIGPALGRYGYYFHTTGLDDGEDALLPLVVSYFNSKGYESIKANPASRISITNAMNMNCMDNTPTVIRYCIDPGFQRWVDAGAGASLLSPGDLAVSAGVWTLNNPRS